MPTKAIPTCPLHRRVDPGLGETSHIDYAGQRARAVRHHTATAKDANSCRPAASYAGQLTHPPKGSAWGTPSRISSAARRIAAERTKRDALARRVAAGRVGAAKELNSGDLLQIWSSSCAGELFRSRAVIVST